MAEVTAAAVKDLREKSGAGMMDCKKALTEAAGDMTVAMDWLRAKGLAAAAKKSSRTAAEGLIGVEVNGTKGAAVEVNSETDFVAKNDQFQTFVRDVTAVALALGDDLETIKKASIGEKTVEDTLTSNIATIGENQNLRRAKRLEVTAGAIVPYVHNAQAPGLGKIGVLVALESEAGEDVLLPLGKQIAMHIAAAFPLALNEDGLDPEIVARERAIATEKAAESGKPADIIAKMVDGAIAKYCKENALVSQLLVMDGKTKISDVVANAAKAAGKAIELKGYVRFQLGEGIEKETSDFAAEVAAASGVPQAPQTEPTA
uniref:translation elongation factor Ts n=1 Tax=uncultured Sphingomonas sp. TaxID=158754 RepID=UPI0035C9C795